MNDELERLRKQVSELETALADAANLWYRAGREDERKAMADAPHDCPPELVHALRARGGRANQPVSLRVHGRDVTAVVEPTGQATDVDDVWEELQDVVTEESA